MLLVNGCMSPRMSREGWGLELEHLLTARKDRRHKYFMQIVEPSLLHYTTHYQ